MRVRILALLMVFSITFSILHAYAADMPTSELSERTKQSIEEYYQSHFDEIVNFITCEPLYKNEIVTENDLDLAHSYRVWVFNGNTDEYIDKRLSDFPYQYTEIWADIGHHSYLVFNDKESFQMSRGVTTFSDSPIIDVDRAIQRMDGQFGAGQYRYFYAYYAPLSLRVAVVVDAEGKEYIYSFYYAMEDFGMENDVFMTTGDFLRAVSPIVHEMMQGQGENTTGGGFIPADAKTSADLSGLYWVLLPIGCVFGSVFVFDYLQKRKTSRS